MSMGVLEKCQVCHMTREWHEQHKPRHSYIADGDDPRLGQPTPPVQLPSALRGDPVLRLALVKSGVIPETAIQEAEVWVREAAASGQAVVVDGGEFKLISVEEWIKAMAR